MPGRSTRVRLVKILEGRLPGAASRSSGETERTLRVTALDMSRLSVGQLRIAAILAGGAIGTLARAGLAEATPHRAGQWPWATFIVNLAGAFILGWVLTRLAERTAPGGMGLARGNQ